MRKIGINFGAYPKIEALEYARVMAEHGFGAIFTETADEQTHGKWAEAFAKYNISYETLHAPFGHINDIWRDTLAGNEMTNELKSGVDRCRQVGAPILVVHLSSGKNPPSITDIGRGRFIGLVEYAEKNNISIAFENQRMLANLAWAFEEFSEAENVGFCWDCGHEGCFTLNREYMPLFGDKLICTHIHDNFCEFDKDLHLLPFDGKIDFNRVARQIKDSGFKGSLMLETTTINSNLYEGVSFEEYISRAAAAAKRLLNIMEE